MILTGTDGKKSRTGINELNPISTPGLTKATTLNMVLRTDQVLPRPTPTMDAMGSTVGTQTPQATTRDMAPTKATLVTVWTIRATR